MDFWSEKILEHMLFLGYLIGEPQKLKDKAKDLLVDWQDMVLSLENPNTRINGISGLVPLLLRTKRFQSDVLVSIDRVSPVGISREELYGLDEHMIMELDYFLGSVRGDVSLEDELSFLALESAQHDKFVLETLVSPPESLASEMGIASGNLSVVSMLHPPKVSRLEEWLKISNDTLEETEGRIESGYLSSIVPVALLEHELTEGRWAIQRVNFLRS